MTETLSVSEAKERLSEIVNKVADSGDRFVIESQGRQVAAIVSADELNGLEEEPTGRRAFSAQSGLGVKLGTKRSIPWSKRYIGSGASPGRTIDFDR